MDFTKNIQRHSRFLTDLDSVPQNPLPAMAVSKAALEAFNSFVHYVGGLVDKHPVPLNMSVETKGTWSTNSGIRPSWRRSEDEEKGAGSDEEEEERRTKFRYKKRRLRSRKSKGKSRLPSPPMKRKKLSRLVEELDRYKFT